MAWYHRIWPGFTEKPRGRAFIERDYQTSPFNQLLGESISDFSPTIYGSYYFNNTWVHRAVKLRADSIAAAKFRIMQETVDESGQDTLVPVPPTHPVQELMDRVNPYWTANDMWRGTETYLGLWGAAYWYIDRMAEGGAPDLWLLRPDKMKTIRRPDQSDLTSHILGYEFSGPGGRRIALTPEEIVPFKYVNPLSSLDGASPLASARLSVDMGRDGIMFNRNTFKNGVHPNNLAFTVEGVLTDDEYDDFMRRLEARYGGADKSNRPFIISNGADAKTLGLSARDMEYSQNLSFSLLEVSRAYGIWPELLASGTTAAFRNVGEAESSFWLSTISSEWEFLETEVTEMLLPLFGISSRNLVAKFDPTGIPALERARNAESRLDLDAVKIGALTINEWRRDKGLDDVPWGDEPMRQADPFGLAPDPNAQSMIAPPNRKALAAPALRRFNGAEAEVEKIGTREQILDEHFKALTQDERSFRSMMRNLFDEQQSSVLASVRAHIDEPGAEFFKPHDWREKFLRRGEPIYEEIIIRAARRLGRRYNLRPLQAADDETREFNPLNPNSAGFRVWLHNRLNFWSDRVNEETSRLLLNEITEARNLGEGLSDIQRRIEKVFNFSDAVRSERIARTESVSATSTGQLELMKSSGVVGLKRWLTSNDERVRESHYQAQAQSPIPLDEDFKVGEDMMQGPGLGSIAKEVVNCRCVALPVLER